MGGPYAPPPTGTPSAAPNGWPSPIPWEGDGGDTAPQGGTGAPVSDAATHGWLMNIFVKMKRIWEGLWGACKALLDIFYIWQLAWRNYFVQHFWAMWRIIKGLPYYWIYVSCDAFLDFLNWLLNTMVQLMPEVPTPIAAVANNTILKAANYFLPLSELLQLLEVCIAVAINYVSFGALLRFARLVR